jgi:hypothetical protein
MPKVPIKELVCKHSLCPRDGCGPLRAGTVASGPRLARTAHGFGAESFGAGAREGAAMGRDGARDSAPTISR